MRNVRIYSLSFLSSLSSPGCLEMTHNCLHRSTGSALVALQHCQSLLFLQLCIQSFAISAPNIVFNVLTNETQEVLGLVTTDQRHFVGGTQIARATKLGQEVVQDVLVVSVDRHSLRIEVGPR